ncbi:MAG: ECF-type sigma factor [Planctomycetota bacterium]
MRRILVEYARAKGSLKRGGGKNRIPLDDHLMAISNSGVDILALDEALKKLADFDERVARIVELRFFAGLTVEEVAGIIEVDPRTVKRDWRVAKTFLLDEMGGGDTLGEAGDTDGS